MEAVHRLDPERLAFELVRRGITVRQLAQRAEVSEMTMVRIRRGEPVKPATLRRLAHALVQSPVITGADLIMSAPETKKAGEAPTPSPAPSAPRSSRPAALSATSRKEGTTNAPASASSV